MLYRHGSFKMSVNINEDWHKYVLKDLEETTEILRYFCVLTHSNCKSILSQVKHRIMEYQDAPETVKHMDLTLLMNMKDDSDSEEISFSL